MNVGEGANPKRGQPDEGSAWEDCVKYGFIAMGGGESWISKSRKPSAGDHLFAYLNKHGYVGYSEIVAPAVPFKDFIPTGESQTLMQLALTADVMRERMQNPKEWDMCVGVRWIKTFDRRRGIKGCRVYPGTLCELRKKNIIAILLQEFDPAKNLVV